MGLPSGASTAGPHQPPLQNGYRCGSNTSSSSGRGSSIQHASLPRHLSTQQRTVSTDLSEVPIITNGLPTVSAHIPIQHHNLAYNTNKQRPPPQQPYYPASNNYYQQPHYRSQPQQQPPPQYNSHYRGPPMVPARKPVQQPQPHPNDYAILKFNGNGSVGKEIDV